MYAELYFFKIYFKYSIFSKLNKYSSVSSVDKSKKTKPR